MFFVVLFGFAVIVRFLLFGKDKYLSNKSILRTKQKLLFELLEETQ